MNNRKIVVLGGGPAGATAALTLARYNVQVLLLEQGAYEQERVGELLSPEGQASIKDAVPELEEQHYLQRIGIVGIWSSPEVVRFSERSWRTLERLSFDRSLAELAESFGAEVKTSAKPTDFVWNGKEWSFRLNGETVTADWIVDATGRSSQFAKSRGAQIQKFDRQVALVAFLEGQVKAEPDMLLEVSADGWWYAAPIDAERAVAVFVTDSDLDKGEATKAWQEHFNKSTLVQERFGNLQLKQQPRRVAAGFSLLVPGYGPGWCSVGDAYAAFDPLSNLGVGRSVEMGFRLGKLFAESWTTGKTPDFANLYENFGAEFRSYFDRLLTEYRGVHRFPGSKFWGRRASVSPYESPLRVRLSNAPENKFLFPEGQNFECSRCGKCCGSKWVPRVEGRHNESFRAMLKEQGTSFRPLRVLEDGRLTTNRDTKTGSCVFLEPQNNDCTLSGTAFRPDSCAEFPFILRETPDGVVVGVSHLCPSIQRNQGVPLAQYQSQLEHLRSRRAPVVIPRVVSVTWGKGTSWSTYKCFEDFLLKGPSIRTQGRSLRWYLARWCQELTTEDPILEGDVPNQSLMEMEVYMGYHLVAAAEGGGSTESEVLNGLLNDEETYFPSLQSTLTFQEFSAIMEGCDLGGLERKIDDFLRALVQRKFLLLNIPLLHNLSVLASLPFALQLYTALHAKRRQADSFSEEDFYNSLGLVESKITAYARHDQIAHNFALWHLASVERA